MLAQCYDIFFSGRTVEGADPATVKRNLAKTFNMGSEQLEYLFAGNSVKVKGGVDQETAIKYRVAFRNAGALVEIQSADPVADSGNVAPPPPLPGQNPEEMTLLPQDRQLDRLRPGNPGRTVTRYQRIIAGQSRRLAG